jgi:hypothetical protein
MLRVSETEAAVRVPSAQATSQAQVRTSMQAMFDEIRNLLLLQMWQTDVNRRSDIPNRWEGHQASPMQSLLSPNTKRPEAAI